MPPRTGDTNRAHHPTCFTSKAHLLTAIAIAVFRSCLPVCPPHTLDCNSSRSKEAPASTQYTAQFLHAPSSNVAEPNRRLNRLHGQSVLRNLHTLAHAPWGTGPAPPAIPAEHHVSVIWGLPRHAIQTADHPMMVVLSLIAFHVICAMLVWPLLKKLSRESECMKEAQEILRESSSAGKSPATISRRERRREARRQAGSRRKAKVGRGKID